MDASQTHSAWIPSGKLVLVVFCALCLAPCAFLSGCATTAKKSAAAPETTADQLDAARKVMGAMAGGREVTAADMKRAAQNMRHDEESRSAVQKILGSTEKPVIKYSPVTGKHYSGDLEYDPETGAKLKVIEE